jgi:hypothetical protein
MSMPSRLLVSPPNSTAAADGNRAASVVGATLSRAVAAAERQALGGREGNEPHSDYRTLNGY